ncbi:MAG: glycerol-3-phosphate acyltransferase [Chloroflexi bacterium]|nr:glycerol-3-phosphate acyltransferase [Chloroflexota bacterium]MBI4267642.1 glycerol-3-phosphate acyltransferase [Chloroflexota bacterium]
MIASGVIAIVLAYLIGSIPSGYIVTRLLTAKDIRKLGGGNVGARNVSHEVGTAAGIGVGVFDIVKGAGAVVLAYWLLGWPQLQTVSISAMLVLMAGVAVVAGHIWPVYLKFTGGNGLATSIGVLSIVMTRELAVATAFIVLFIVVTRNVILSTNIGLISVLVSLWFFDRSWLYFVFAAVLSAILVLNFLPVAMADFAQAGSREKFFARLLRKEHTEGKTGKPSR